MNTTETSPGWQAGFASGHLALPSDCALAGYGVPRQAQKEHDPLLVQAAVLEKPDGLRLLYVNLDVLAVDELLISTIRQEAARAGLETGHLLVQAIHTHCGPAGILRTDQGLLQAAAWFAGLPDAVLVSSLAQSCVQVLLEAEKNLQPVLVSQSRATCQGFTSNRVLEKEIASPVYVLEAATPSQKACFVFAASHPTVLGPDTLETSADLVWGLRKALQKDGYDPVFYVNGACGDLSCRYTRRAATFEEAERLGTLLADCVLQALQEKTPLDLNGSGLIRLWIPLPAARSLSTEEAAAQLREAKKRVEQAQKENAPAAVLRKKHVLLEAAQAQVQKARFPLHEATVPACVWIWKWQEEIFFTWPGELFSSLPCLQSDHVHPFCYANGYLLYLADRAAHENSVYEAVCSPFDAEAFESFSQILEGCLSSLRKDPAGTPAASELRHGHHSV